MKTLVTALPGASGEWLPIPALTGPDLTGPSGIFATVRSGFNRRAMGDGLRRFYGWCTLLTAPREAIRLKTAAVDSALARHLGSYAHISTMAARPFVCSRWSGRMRLRRIIEHCAIVDELGPPFDLSHAQFVEIIAFTLGDSPCRLTFDKPEWLGCDGLLCASVWVESDRILSITFCLSDEGGLRTAYVGGIQGRRDSGALDQNRILTKVAHGMRPRDLAFELFRMMLPRLGVTRLQCVADDSRYQKTRRGMLAIGANDKVQLDYDEIWASRGGIPGGDGFFLVPGQRQQRDVDDIPAKKRSLYARRYALLDQLHAAILGALENGMTISLHGGSPAST